MSALQKQKAAEASLQYIPEDAIVGVGTGSTVHFLIEYLAKMKGKIQGCVSSSEDSSAKLKAHGIRLLDLNSVGELDIYIDGADEVNPQKHLIKGGGAALTREKILAACSRLFVCIVDQSKYVPVLGKFPLPIEVIPLARSYVARQIVKLGGRPVYREGVVTDNGNSILDIHQLEILNPLELETKLNQITGVVTNGLFAHRPADIVLMGTDQQVMVMR